MTPTTLDLELPGMPPRPPAPAPPPGPSTRLQARALVLLAAHLATHRLAGWGVQHGPTELVDGWLWVNRQTLEALTRRGLVDHGFACTVTPAGLEAIARIVRAPLRTEVRRG